MTEPKIILAPIPPQVKRIHKILIDPNMIKVGVAFALSVVVNCMLVMGYLILIPQTHKESLYQTYEMGYSMGINCEKNPSFCASVCFELLENDTRAASCARGLNDGYRSKDELQSR